MPNLSGLHELLHGTRHVLDRHVRIDAVLVKQIDYIGAQALQSLVRDLTNALGPAIGGLRRVTVAETELRRDHDVTAHGFQSLTDNFLVDEGPISLSRVKEGHAALDR